MYTRETWPPNRWFIFALTLILLLAAALRIVHIGQQSLWIDEGATYFILQQPDLLAALATRDHHPPGYYLLLKGWIALAGSSVVSMRMLSAFFSILSVAAVVPLARALHRSDRWFSAATVPALAALVLALSDPEVVLAQEVRMYALRTFLVILSALFYIRWMARPSTRRALPWIIVTTALLHVQYQGLYIVLAQGLHALLFLRGAVRLRAVAILALIGGLFAPWFIAIGFDQRLNDPGIQAALPSTWGTLEDMRHKFLTGQWPLMLGLLLLGVFHYESSRLRLRDPGAAFLLAFWVFGTVAVTFIANLWFPVLAPHRILLITPAIAILIARGLRNLPAPARGFLVAVIVVYGVTTVDDYYPKEPWDRMAASLTAYARPGEMALLEVYRGDNPLTYYLDRDLPAGTQVESLRHWREFWPERYPHELLPVLAAHDTVWLAHWSPDQSAFEFLQTTGHVPTAVLTTDHWGNALNVYRFDRLDGLLNAPPAAAYQNGMTLHRAVIDPERMRVDLWWSAGQPLAHDYTVSAFVLDASGALVAQHDSFPLENRRPTTSWSPGELVYDPHPLQPADLALGLYSVGVQVYTYFDGARVFTIDDEPWAVVGTLVR